MVAKAKRSKKRKDKEGGPQPATRDVVQLELAKKPLAVARALSALLLLVGLFMLVLGGGVLSGRITEGWGFPMSAVPNWGRPWGAVLMLGGFGYVVCPILLFARPQKGTVAMMILAGLGVLLGTPLITTTTEIFYNLLAQKDCQADWTQCRPDWIDSVWGYFMIVNVATLIAIYRTQGGEQVADAARAKS